MGDLRLQPKAESLPERLRVNSCRRAHETADRVEQMEGALRAIMKATVEGRVCDDVAWFDDITTLHDFCDLVLNGPDAEDRAALSPKPAGEKGR